MVGRGVEETLQSLIYTWLCWVRTKYVLVSLLYVIEPSEISQIRYSLTNIFMLYLPPLLLSQCYCMKITDLQAFITLRCCVSFLLARCAILLRETLSVTQPSINCSSLIGGFLEYK